MAKTVETTTAEVCREGLVGRFLAFITELGIVHGASRELDPY